MYKRRVAILLSAMGLVFLALLGRLFVLQIVHGQACRDEYEQSLTRTSYVTASRGAILDRNGNVLARDNVSYEFCMDYGLIAEDPTWIRNQQRALKRQLKGTPDADRAGEIFQERMERALAWAVQACGGEESFESVRRRTVARVERIAEIINDRPWQMNEYHAIAQLEGEAHYRYFRDHIEGLPGVAVRHGSKRDYPAGEFACHVIGQVRPVFREDLAAYNLTADEEPDAVKRALYNYRPSDVIGESGVEKLCEFALKPTRGYESTTAGRPVETIPAHDGRDVHLTLDMRLQVRLTKFFRESYPYHNGAILVMDVPTGEILAMVSIPTYNQQTYWRRVSEAAAEAATASPPPRNSQEWIDRPYALLVKDDLNFPLRNRCITRLYPPGSTVKPITAAAALTEGIINARTTIVCRGHMLENKPNELRCTGQHGALPLDEAILRSCNAYFNWCGAWMYRKDPEMLPRWQARFGLFDEPGTGLSVERAGSQNLPADPIERRVDMWQSAIGQGKLLVTPLHVVNLMATIARNGEMIQPSIIRPGEGGPVPKRGHVPVPPEHWEPIRAGMLGVTSKQGGTAYKVWVDKGGHQLGFEVCGKSGTAQVSKDTRFVTDEDGTRRREILRTGNMCWFAGFAPARNPKVAFVAVVEYVHYLPGMDMEGIADDGTAFGGGASVAGPLCIEALKACKELGYITTSGQ